MERVLILSMGFGTGHNAAARALAEQFQQTAGIEVRVVDLLHLIPGKSHPYLQSGYNQMLMKFPRFYHYLYGWTYQSRLFRYFSGEVIEKIGWTIRKKLNALLYEWQPTRIVTTHPFSLLIIPPKWRGLPTVGVMTDYELHPLWLVQPPKVLCVPKKILDRPHFDRITWRTGCRIVETGIPTNPVFTERIKKRAARQCLGYPVDRPVVLVMGGGLGLGPLGGIVTELNPTQLLQVVVVTGKNDSLYQELMGKGLGPHIQVEKYRNDIPLLMDAADLLITKPGGLTVAEAMLKRLPMLLLTPLPGHEQANQDYLLFHRVADVIHPGTVSQQVRALLENKTLRKRMQFRQGALAAPDAAERIKVETLRLGMPRYYVL